MITGFRRVRAQRATACRRLALAVATILALSSLTGCQCRKSSSRAVDAGETARSYSVRGVVRQLPDAELAGVPLLIQHEAIPDFVDSRAEPAPMDRMTMPFSIDGTVSLADLEVGDKVAFTLRVDWRAANAMLITSIRKLAPETTLELD